MLIRPEAAQIVPPDSGGENVVDGRLQAISFRGRFQIVSIAIPDTEIVFKFEMETAVSLPAVGGEIRIAINPEHIQLLTQS